MATDANPIMDANTYKLKQTNMSTMNKILKMIARSEKDHMAT